MWKFQFDGNNIIMNTKKSILKTVAVFCASASSVCVGQVYDLTEQSWDNPAFKARFTESYLGQSEVNPSITAEEKALFDQILPLIGTAPKEAIELMESSLKEDSSAAFDYILGNLLYQEGDLSGSVAAYKKATRKFPTYAQAYYNAGRAHVANEDYAKALPMLQKSLSLQTGDGTLYGLIGYCYINMEKPSTALDAYRMAVMLEPSSKDWKIGKLQCHVALEQRTDAIGMLYELIVEDPKNADWWKLQANQFLDNQEVDKAAANLTVVKEMGKADAATLSLLGDLLLNEGLTTPALESYYAAIDSKNVSVSRMLEVANSLILLDESDQASELIVKMETVLGSDLAEGEELSFLNLKARLALSVDDKAKAGEYLEQVVDRDPMNGNALLTLADLEKSKGDIAKAKFYAENASKVEAFEHQACLTLAQLNVGQHDYRTAARFLRRAQQIEPKDYIADYLLKIEQAALRM